MKTNPEWRSVRIGLLVALALVVAALAIVGISSRQNLFERKAEYYSYFPDALGLKEGSGVWYQGVQVGFISKISFSRDPDIQHVRVDYKINASLVPRIRSGTRASIRTLGMLGDKYLALISPTFTSNEPIILPGHEIPIDKTLNLEVLGKGAQDLISNTIELSKNINLLVSAINNGQGTLSRLLNDPTLGKETAEHLRHIGDSLDTIASSIADGRGLAGKLLVDPAYGEKTARDLSDSLARTNQILRDIQEGKGGAGAFLAKKGDGERIVRNLALTSDALAKVAAGLQRPGTLGNKLFMDDAYGEQLGGNLLSISDSLASILKKVDEGKGTLGALVNDRSVYDTLSAVAEGIRKSPIVSWYLKRKAETAAEAAKRRAEERGTTP